jgi:hypothetical protein
LQLVLDLSPDQLAALKAELRALAQKGQVKYGIHVSDTALMTCFVQGVADNQHIHFIDGADGGLAMAAADFKARQ